MGQNFRCGVILSHLCRRSVRNFIHLLDSQRVVHLKPNSAEFRAAILAVLFCIADLLTTPVKPNFKNVEIAHFIYDAFTQSTLSHGDVSV